MTHTHKRTPLTLSSKGLIRVFPKTLTGCSQLCPARRSNTVICPLLLCPLLSNCRWSHLVAGRWTAGIPVYRLLRSDCWTPVPASLLDCRGERLCEDGPWCCRSSSEGSGCRYGGTLLRCPSQASNVSTSSKSQTEPGQTKRWTDQLGNRYFGVVYMLKVVTLTSLLTKQYKMATSSPCKRIRSK